MGVDRGIHVDIPAAQMPLLQPIHVSKILAKIAKDEKIDVVIVGKQVSFKNSRFLSTSIGRF